MEYSAKFKVAAVWGWIGEMQDCCDSGETERSRRSRLNIFHDSQTRLEIVAKISKQEGRLAICVLMTY